MNTTKQINIMVALVFIAVITAGAYTMWDPTARPTPGRADSTRPSTAARTSSRRTAASATATAAKAALQVEPADARRPR